ncbi:MAG: HAD family hydrolase [Candidatus Hermodarchaeota archaeon]
MFENYLVIFDMDGVLADTGKIHYESWAKMAKEDAKVDYSRKFFEETFGQQSIPITRKLVGPEVDLTLVVKWANLKEHYYREMVKDKLEPLPGVIELIKELKSKKFKLAVGSSGPLENVELLLSCLNIKHYFDVIITAEDVKNGKPAPDVFLICSERLNIIPSNCIVIEDAPVGIQAAITAGMKSIALTTTHEMDELSIANFVVKDLSSVNTNTIIEILKINSEE